MPPWDTLFPGSLLSWPSLGHHNHCQPFPGAPGPHQARAAGTQLAFPVRGQLLPSPCPTCMFGGTQAAKVPDVAKSAQKWVSPTPSIAMCLGSQFFYVIVTVLELEA